MDTILEFLSQKWEHLFNRADGPLWFRLIFMPLVVSVMAVRAHLKDVRSGRPTPLWAFVRDPVERRRLFRSGLKDFGRVFIVACVLDTIYQYLVFRSFYVGEMLIVAVVCAIVPYFLIRGPISRIIHLLRRKGTGTGGGSVAKTTGDSKAPPSADQ